jgi:very-short-patch-repair endonuclease
VSSPKARLIIELDGSQHLEEDVLRHDEERTKYLKSQGYKVIRIWNNAIMKDIESVLRAIILAMESDNNSQ